VASRFPRLFAPGRIGRLTLRNRIIMAPMEKNLATVEGAVTQRYVDYCERRAAGGAALIMLESMYVDPTGKNHHPQLGLHDDALIPGYRRLIAACHRHGALVGAELQFGGRQTSSAITGFQPVAPSPVACSVLTVGDTPRELTGPEIHAIVRRFADAARRALAAGFDVVEVHGAHGYLVGQFLSPYSNRRTDEYGGDLARRLRFPTEVIAAVRAAVGPEVPVLYRISADEHVPDGLTIDDVCEILPHLERAGVDLVDVSAGIYESALWIVQPMEMPPACLAPLSRRIRARATVPVSVAGRITEASVAESVLDAGDADFITLGRALHADPDMPRKSLEGRLDEICSCVGCLKCSELLGQNLPVLCMANTATAREREYAIRPTSRRQRALVVGAGPAGLEAARVLAARGHAVTVVDRNGEPGGQMLLSRHVPGRQDLAGLVTYLSGAVVRAGGEIRLGVDVTEDLVRRESPDFVVVATGARAGIPPIPGIEKSPAVDPFEVLRRARGGVRRALVIGGGMLGVGVAHALAERGTQVQLAEPGGELASELGLRPRWRYVADLRERENVTVHLNSTVETLWDDGALLRSQEREVEIKDVDLVVATRPRVPVNELIETLGDLPDAPPVFAIGDCVLPRTAFDAMQEGAALGHRL
jgi:2,4-dienoyl-CoA reductase-like NADH-dependent reductase (Old Yellow Enzyme family)/NADPH-dependent 2,4-dienoyl-CoA reductase/sulfur reductase-like enzyme